MKSLAYKYAFLFIQTILYGTFLILDILGKHISLSNYIKFTLVILCFLYVLISRNKDHGIERKLLSYALAFTVISDLLILILDYYFLGVLTFILAQQLYGLRISSFYDRPLKNFFFRLFCQGIISAAVCILLWQLDILVNGLLIVSVFYFLSILTNVIRCLKYSIYNKEDRNIRYFAIGMVLFLLCDINVGLFNLSAFLPVGKAFKLIYSISSILMWTFYAPSQVLIALSGEEKK